MEEVKLDYEALCKVLSKDVERYKNGLFKAISYLIGAYNTFDEDCEYEVSEYDESEWLKELLNGEK